MKAINSKANCKSFALGVWKALRRAAKAARKTARAHHTPIYVCENGKVVAKKPTRVSYATSSSETSSQPLQLPACVRSSNSCLAEIPKHLTKDTLRSMAFSSSQ